MTVDEIVGKLRDLVEQARAFARSRGLDWRHGAAAAGVVVVGLAVAGLAGAGSGGRAIAEEGQRLTIEVVQPVEPVFTAGPVMEVGTLVDTFDPASMPAPEPPPDAYPQDVDYPLEEPKAREGFLRRFSSALQQALPREERAPPSRIRREDRSYGFDEPRPDWAAEREARRAWRDRIEAERRAEREARQRMNEPSPYDDVEGAPVD